ncbi:MAG TPA: stage III sporulation protein AB, partial [Bacillota bacterium]|nr:stage III sporulation protein AB [Bacillota bacterium]
MFELGLKTAGAACIVAAAAAFGENKARTLERRVQQLEQFQRSLKLLATEISFARSLLPAAFTSVGRQCTAPVRELYLNAAELMTAHPEMSAGRAWELSLSRIYPQSCFSALDRDTISSLGDSLGVSQREGQLKQIRLVEQHLSFNL